MAQVTGFTKELQDRHKLLQWCFGRATVSAARERLHSLLMK